MARRADARARAAGRAYVAASARPLFAAEALARQKAGKSADGAAGGRGKAKPSPQSAGKVSDKSGEASRQAAAATGAGQKSTAAVAAAALDGGGARRARARRAGTSSRRRARWARRARAVAPTGLGT